MERHLKGASLRVITYAGTAGVESLAEEKAMAVVGMGGFFFRSSDPAALKAWYRDHLGVGGGCGSDPQGQSSEWLWHTQGGPMVFEPFKADSDYFAADKQVMINLRVTDLDALCAGLEAAGIEVTTRDEWNSMPEVGRFARIHDPEGNPIELWQPANLS